MTTSIPAASARKSPVQALPAVRDVLDKALDGERILETASVDEMLSPQFAGLDPDHGIFWYRWTVDGEQVWGHNGGEDGVSTEILFWDDGTGAVVRTEAWGQGWRRPAGWGGDGHRGAGQASPHVPS